jgi:hypothetical protein
MTTETRTYYLTKYALSAGIKAVLCESPSSDGYCRPADYYSYFKLGRDIFETLAEAQADAEARRIKKIASLKKQIAKLEKMTLEVKS